MSNTQQQLKIRSSNLELYRIISMFLILSGHSLFNSGMLIDIWGGVSLKNMFIYGYGIWGKTCINGFLMITGYFMCSSNITIRKYFKLLSEILFYNVLIGGIFLITGYSGYTASDFLRNLIPIHSISDGFTSCFLIFYLFIPFLNKLIESINYKLHRNLLLLLLFTYTGLNLIPDFIIKFNYITWFAVIYILAAFIKKYPKHIYNSDSVKTWFGFSICSILLSLFSVIFCILITKVGIHISPFHFIIDSNAIFAVLTAFCTFMFFKNIRLPHIPLINAIGATTFGILCIHANNDTMQEFIWIKMLDCHGYYYKPYFCIYIILSCILLFIICSFLDWIRIITVERWWLSSYDKHFVFKSNDK